jgi:antitoxin component YwqK of YwqJK toxin-antitoxin module
MLPSKSLPGGKTEACIDVLKNELSGPFRRYTQAGVLLGTGTFLHGKTDGILKEFYPNGKLMTSQEVKLGKAMGVGTHYDESGQKISEEIYENDH